MAEYIERDAILESIAKKHGTRNDVEEKTALDIWDDIKKIPAADVVPVVRCKDCKHKEILTDSINRKISTICLLGEALHFVEDNHYCSYGERRCDNDS